MSEYSDFDLATELTILYEQLFLSPDEELAAQDFAVRFCKDLEEIRFVLKAHQELLQKGKSIDDFY